MQSKGFIKLIAGLLFLACVYQLSFTFKTRSVERQAAQYAAQFPGDTAAERHYLDSLMASKEAVYNLGLAQFTYKSCKEKELNLGLDLKGGMNVMLEVQVEEVLKTLARDKKNDPAFVAAIAEAKEAMKKGKSKDFVEDFVAAFKAQNSERSLAEIFVSPDRYSSNEGGNSDFVITLDTPDGKVVSFLKSSVDNAIETSKKVLVNRIDGLGVIQPNILRMGNSNRILVELPGIKEPQRVRELLGKSANMAFWTTFDSKEIYPYLVRIDEHLRSEYAANKAHEAQAEESAENTSELMNKASELASQSSLQKVREQSPLLALLDPRYSGGASVGAALKSDMDKINEYLSRADVKNMLPSDLTFMWGFKANDKMDGRYSLYAIRKGAADEKAPLDGSFVTNATQQFSQFSSQSEVSMTMNSKGAKIWADLTEKNIGKCIAIVLDNQVYSAPVVNGKIDRGMSQITGDFSIEEAKDLANVLVSGRFPAPSKIIQDTVVGPSLGQESINAGLFSFVVAFILVLLYMGLFYKSAGWMSDIALLFNVFLLLGVLVSFGAVLTLPGIAGIVLTMGMAVDANVIIYERIKEELRGGKGLSLAISDGFSKAYSAIIDGNLTTILTGIVLFIFGTGPVQGFATTLIIGILTSFFCAVFITRMLIEWIVSIKGHVSFSRGWSERFLANTHFDFIKARKISYMAVLAVIVISGISLAVNKLNPGTEFTGGRAYVVRFDKEVSAEEVRSAVNAAFADKVVDKDKNSNNVTQFGGKNQVRILTQYKHDDTSEEVTKEVESILYEALKGIYNESLSFEEFTNTQLNENGIVTSDKIGPSIAHDMIWNSIKAVLFSLLAIGLYITFRFKYWQWAVGATFALAFNVFLIIGLFSLLYGFMPYLEVNQAFIAAILTIIGYAINDTVVVFDRIREYLTLFPKRDFRENVNNAINSTLSRTINTSGTTLVTLLAIFFFGGESIRGFIFALTVGVVVGTAATIFIATPVAYELMKKHMVGSEKVSHKK